MIFIYFWIIIIRQIKILIFWKLSKAESKLWIGLISKFIEFKKLFCRVPFRVQEVFWAGRYSHVIGECHSQHAERWNSKGRSGYDFDQFFKNKFCRFPTVASRSDPYMINPSIESSNFLLWHEKKIDFRFWKFCGKQTN